MKHKAQVVFWNELSHNTNNWVKNGPSIAPMQYYVNYSGAHGLGMVAQVLFFYIIVGLLDQTPLSWVVFYPLDKVNPSLHQCCLGLYWVHFQPSDLYIKNHWVKMGPIWVNIVLFLECHAYGFVQLTIYS